MSRGAHFRIEGVGPTGEPVKKWAARFVDGEFKKKVIIPSIVDALNRTAAKSNTRAIRRTAKASKLPVKVVRSRAKPLRANRRMLDAGARVMVRPVNPVTSLNVRQTRKGVRAGKHSFPGSFLATSSLNQRQLVFTREGPARLPLDVEKIKLKDYDRAWPIIMRRYARTFMPRRLGQQLDYRSKKFGAR